MIASKYRDILCSVLEIDGMSCSEGIIKLKEATILVQNELDTLRTTITNLETTNRTQATQIITQTAEIASLKTKVTSLEATV